MNHKCKNWWFNDHGGMVTCEKCGKDYFFTELGITAKEVIHAGGYDTIDGDGIPQHDIEMIQFLVESEKERANK